MNINSGQVIGGIIALITLSLFILNAGNTSAIISQLGDSTTKFARVIIGPNAGGG